MKLLLSVAVFFLGVGALGQDAALPPALQHAYNLPSYTPLPDLSSAPTRDGINPKEANRFWQRWHAVTTRFRTDTLEMRFVYANDLAWKTMVAGKKDFPDGAMFGKLGFEASDDPSFPSSLEPDHFSRLQLMKKDAHKYATHGGWGYYVVYGTEAGSKAHKVEDAEPAACYACHKIVEDRDYVFSRPAFFLVPKTKASFKQSFRSVKWAELSPLSQTAFHFLGPGNPAAIKYHDMTLFAGSIDESLVPISHFSTEDKSPYLLVDEKTKQFALASPASPSAGCHWSSQVARTAKAEVRSQDGKVEGEKKTVVEVGELCDGTVTWKDLQPLPDAVAK